MISDLLLKGSKVLNKQEMKNITGGVTVEEYCATMEELWEENVDSWSAETIEGFWHGWSTHCK